MLLLRFLFRASKFLGKLNLFVFFPLMIACSIPIVVASLLYQRDRPMSDLMFGIIATPGIVLLAIMTFFIGKP